MDNLPAVNHGDKEIRLILADELVRRMTVQARNLLFEYRNGDAYGAGKGNVPADHAQPLMEMYGRLIAIEIFKSLTKGMSAVDAKSIESFIKERIVVENADV